MVVVAAMFIEQNHQHARRPAGRGAQGVMDAGDQAVSIHHVMRRVHVARPIGIGKVTRFDERVGRQRPPGAIGMELLDRMKVSLMIPQPGQHQGLRKIVKINVPAMGGLSFQPIENGFHHVGKM
jgi:hypothetical protein